MEGSTRNVQSVSKNAKKHIFLQSLTINISKVYWPNRKIFCSINHQVMLYQSIAFDCDRDHSKNAISGGMGKIPSPISGVFDMQSPKEKCRYTERTNKHWIRKFEWYWTRAWRVIEGGAKTFDPLILENESDDPHFFFSKPRVLVKYYKLT